MKGLGLLTRALSNCVISTILAGCGANSAMVPQGSRADASTRFISRTPGLALQPRRSTYTDSVLYSFKGNPDGESPFGDLVTDSTGALYGTTYLGGAYSFGSVFKLVPSVSGYTERTLWSFGGSHADGSAPYAGLTIDKHGALYGTTQQGGRGSQGTVFKLTPSASGYTERILWNFDYGNDGGLPDSVLIFDKKGALYGTTAGGGRYEKGTVFKLTPSGSGYTERVVHSFCANAQCSDGWYPIGGVVFGTDGNLYGTSFKGGSGDCITDHAQSGCGTVFKLTPSGRGYRVLYSFKNTPDGAYPAASVALDRRGTLYGTTTEGGDAGKSINAAGTVFMLTPSASGYTERILHNFTGGMDGEEPWSRVIFGQNGTLYGTAGVVFRLAPPAYREHVLYRFKGGADGEGPWSGLTFGSHGELYGTTDKGGGNGCGGRGCGTVFELNR